MCIRDRQDGDKELPISEDEFVDIATNTNASINDEEREKLRAALKEKWTFLLNASTPLDAIGSRPGEMFSEKDVDEIVAQIMGELPEEEIGEEAAEEIEDDIRDALQPEELPETFVRWGELAGIIKG